MPEWSLPAPRESGSGAGRSAQYALIKFLDLLIRREWRSTGIGLGNVVELRVAGRRSGRYRSVLLTLLREGERWFLGHPNGDVAWTLNLEAAGTADSSSPGPCRSRSVLVDSPARPRCADAPLRPAPVPATSSTGPPARHIRAVGVYFEVDRSPDRRRHGAAPPS